MLRPLPEPMLARSGPLPKRAGYAYEVKWDGFRALVSTGDGFRVRSRRGWDMTNLVPELRTVPPGLVLDGELVAIVDGVPYFPAVCARLLHRVEDVVLTYIAFDLLAADGRSLPDLPYLARRERLEALRLPREVCVVNGRFEDRLALWDVVVEQGLEGVVAKRLGFPVCPRRPLVGVGETEEV